jgi:hypothetical protein
MESRCIRCHGGGGHFNDDPDHTGIGSTPPMGSMPGIGLPPIDGIFTQLDDTCTATVTSGCHGLLAYTTDAGRKALFKGYIHSTSDGDGTTVTGRMPPPPSPLLTSRQIEILDKWLDNPL